MQLIAYLKSRQWSVLAGYVLFIGMMATGYIYHITFVQLGLDDFGTRVLGLDRPVVASYMALLALITCVSALVFGWLMMRMGWGKRFIIKLRVVFAVVLVQLILTAVVLLVQSQTTLLVWMVLASIALGIGMPVTFSMTVDLIPVRDRGYVAAIITAAAYAIANLLPSDWQIEQFRVQLLPVMLIGVIGMGLLAFVRLPLIEALSQQHTFPQFGRGRFVRVDRSGHAHIRRRMVIFLVLMFGVYFIDSLGFLRMIHIPYYVDDAWRSQELAIRGFIAGVHVLAAFIAGVLYVNLHERSLFLWIFGIFALIHFMPASGAQLVPGETAPLGIPMLYAVAVSLYTVISFAAWADISTPETISRNAALGVALSGFTATFISTSLAIQWAAGDMPLDQHLRIVDALAMLFFLLVLVLSFIPRKNDRVTAAQQSERGDL
jgi:MFS family permease